MDDAAVLKRRGYTLGISLGEGSYAKVKSAYSDRLKTNIAVKIIDRKRAPADFLEKFLPREMEILALVNHRNIVKTYEIFETSDGKVYIIMELGVHGDLLEYIKAKGPLPEEVARKMFRQLTVAIKHCHDMNIVHRDLKCENLLLDANYNIKLADFGFARHCACDDHGKTLLCKTFCGSAAYAAPEVLQGIPYQAKVYDIWSMGVVLFIMVCGSMPYDDSNIKRMLRIQKEHRVDFPRSKYVAPECKELIIHILNPDVMKRLNADDILAHPWLQSTKPKTPEDGKKEGESVQVPQQQKEQSKVEPKSDKTQSKSEIKAETKAEHKPEPKTEPTEHRPETKAEFKTGPDEESKGSKEDPIFSAKLSNSYTNKSGRNANNARKSSSKSRQENQPRISDSSEQ